MVPEFDALCQDVAAAIKQQPGDLRALLPRVISCRAVGTQWRRSALERYQEPASLVNPAG